MRESMIIVPKADNDGNRLDSVLKFAQTRLCNAFGGCTTRDAFGQWVSPSGELISEPVSELVSACEPGNESDRTLRALARDVCSMGRQQSVYLRLPSGNVELIEAESVGAMVPLAA